MAWQRWAGIAFCLLWLMGCTGAPLYSALSEQQANEVIAELQSANIPADKARAKGNDPVWSVLVDANQFDAAMRVLKAAGLPRESRQNFGQIFKKEGFVSSALEEKARYIFGLEESFEATLMGIEGVVSASVHIALPERDLVSETVKPARASVTILKEPGSTIEMQKANIISIVKNGVEGLENPDNITVIFFDAHKRPERALSSTAWTRQQMITAALAAVALLGAIAAVFAFVRTRQSAAPQG
jgi:type III secretion protein J